jgi:photosystem II stability/assembly factor-like uncharacterized protein
MCQPEGSYPVKFDLNHQVGWVACQGGGANMLMPKRVYRTENGGRTWILISKRQFGAQTPIPDVGLAPSPPVIQLIFQDGQRGWMIVGSAGPGVYRTRDGGYSWDAIEEFGNDTGAAAILFPENGIVVVRTYRGSWISRDDGITWSPLP